MQVQPKISNLSRVFRICLVLMIFFFIASLVLGSSNKRLALDNQILEIFLKNAANVKPNFEESLNLYTQGTQDSINYVQTLRPDSESEYIEFISSVEAIGQNLSLSVDLESLESPKPDNLGSVLRYQVEFFGGESDLDAFLRELEALPYYIRVEEVHFKSLELADKNLDKLSPNVILTIQLYVR